MDVLNLSDINYIPFIMCVCVSELPNLILAKYMYTVSTLSLSPLSCSGYGGGYSRGYSTGYRSTGWGSRSGGFGGGGFGGGFGGGSSRSSGSSSSSRSSSGELLASPSVRLHIRWLEYNII